MWIAHYLDTSQLRQYDESDREFQFKDIKQDILEKFEVVKGNKTYIVNLASGEISLNGLKIGFTESGKTPHRLIYFRRVRQSISTGGQPQEDYDEFIGFQSMFKGNNTKRLFSIKSNGTLIQE